MTRFWWQLPGPSQFIEQVVQDFRDGKNVILCLPEHLPSGLSSAIKSELGDDWDWHNVSVEEASSVEPVHFLFDLFVGEISPNEFRNARTLAEHPSFAGKIVWLDDFTPALWPAWRRFLSDYEQPCRSISQLSRTLFCVPLVGELALDPPRDDVCLSHHRWQGVVSRLDILLFTASLFQDKRLPDLQKRVVISVVTNLALWDFDVSERLASEKSENILNPMLILQEIAKERNWCTDNHGSLLPKWCIGITNTIDAEEKFHSAALAINGSGKTEIERRIWRAEVGELLPFVEERRREILERLSEVLQVPFTTRFGEVIKDLHDLEIGHIEYQISNNGKNVNSEIRNLVRRLREIRNALSHLESIKPELLVCREINDWHRILKR
ncbi:MAG TPA: hypothetical protein V6D15_18375 [Oculatellaceae cyanobacterium]|jgi:hypothetical protein